MALNKKQKLPPMPKVPLKPLDRNQPLPKEPLPRNEKLERTGN